MGQELRRDVESWRNPLTHQFQESLQVIARDAFQRLVDPPQTARHRNDRELSSQVVLLKGIAHLFGELAGNQERTFIAREFIKQRVNRCTIIYN